MDLTANLPAALSALADLGLNCALRFGVWTVGTSIVALVLGAGFGMLVARPLLRWGLGEARVVSTVAIIMLAACGAVGGLWAGMWAGTAACVDLAVEEHYLLEDFVVNGLIAVAWQGAPSDDPVENAERLREAMDDAGGSLQDLLEDVVIELESEGLGKLPRFLSPSIVPQLIEKLEEHRLFEPEAMAEIVALGGFQQALSDETGEHYEYATHVVEMTEPLRRDVSTAVFAAAVTNAVVALPFVLSVPMLLIATVAIIGRLIRQPKRRPEMVG
ncbi:MAG: hypothetical protein GY906_37825 [bacterium]|nr:hypothetical protein [bacterium]